jgi:hypothetical protein
LQTQRRWDDGVHNLIQKKLQLIDKLESVGDFAVVLKQISPNTEALKERLPGKPAIPPKEELGEFSLKFN